MLAILTLSNTFTRKKESLRLCMKQIIYLPNPNNISMQTTVVDAYKPNNKHAGTTEPESILSLVYYSTLKNFQGVV